MYCVLVCPVHQMMILNTVCVVFSHILCISWYYVYKLYNACCILCHWVFTCDALQSWWSVGRCDLNWKVIAIRWLGLFQVNVEYCHDMIYLQAVGQMAKILPIMQNFASQYQHIDSSNHGIYIYSFFFFFFETCQY